MIVRFLGHAAFELHVGGLRLCLDPHRPGAVGGRFSLPEIAGPFDAIVVSHGHEDHCGWTPALGTQRILDRDMDLPAKDGSGDVSLSFRTVPHDDCGGAKMGFSRMIRIEHGDNVLVHCGDVGALNDDDYDWLADIDLLLVPVGGTYTIDGREAAALCARIKPTWVMPMHAADPRIDLPLGPIEPFITAAGRAVVRADTFDSAAPPLAGTTVLLTGP